MEKLENLRWMMSMSELIEFDKKNKKRAYLIGTDEAGRGPAAGAVYAAAVCFINPQPTLLEKLNDSKKLSETKRESLFNEIKSNSIWSICYSDVAQIESVNILNASLDAMRRACINVIKQLNSTDVEVFVDGNKLIKNFDYEQKCLIKGDAKSASIAAASILAKVERDRVMRCLDSEFPQYKWAANKGYLTKEHIEAIKQYGITKYHRKLFVRNILCAENASQLTLV